MFSLSLFEQSNASDIELYIPKATAALANAPRAVVSKSAAVGWKQESNGWTFYNKNGTKTTNYWINDNINWYYIKSDGFIATGWQQINGFWYYLKSIGEMATGWIKENGTWYYLYSNGSMATDTIIDGYKISSNGTLI